MRCWRRCRPGNGIQPYDIGLRTLEQTLEEYQSRLKRRLEESTRMRAVGADVPRIVGVCA